MQTPKDWELVLCTGAEHLEKELVRAGFSVLKSERNYDGSRKFANSDVYTRFAAVDRIQGKRVCVIQSFTCSGEASIHNFTTGDRVLEVLQALDILTHPRHVQYIESEKRKFLKLTPPLEIIVLALHLPFSKQDQVYLTGESNACHTAIRTILSAGAKKIVTIDPHPPVDFSWFEHYLESGEIEIISMYPRVLSQLRQDAKFSEIAFVSTPGKTRSPLAQEVKSVDKERVSTNKVLLEGDIGDLRRKRVFLVDDMVISGTTIKNARKLFLSQGASEVYCWITHALPFANGKEENLRRLVDAFDEKIFVSNTVRSQTFHEDYPFCSMSCVPLIIEDFLCKEGGAEWTPQGPQQLKIEKSLDTTS